MESVTVVLAETKYAVTLSKEKLRSLFPTSLITSAIDLDATVETMTIENKEVTAELLDLIHHMVITNKIPPLTRNSDLTPGYRYLGIDIFEAIAYPGYDLFARLSPGINLLQTLSSDDYFTALQFAIIAQCTGMINYLFRTIPQQDLYLTADTKMLIVAIIAKSEPIFHQLIQRNANPINASLSPAEQIRVFDLISKIYPHCATMRYQDRYGQALTVAGSYGMNGIVTYLLDGRIDPIRAEFAGLKCALYNGHPDTARLFLTPKFGRSTGILGISTLYQYAATRGYLDLIKDMIHLQFGHHPVPRLIVRGIVSGSMTGHQHATWEYARDHLMGEDQMISFYEVSLSFAASSGLLSVVTMVLEMKILSTSIVRSALSLAMDGGHTEVITRILQEPDPELLRSDRDLVLRRAITSGDVKMVKLLLSDPRCVISRPVMLYRVAIRHDYLDIVRILLADPKMVLSQGGRIELKLAVSGNHLEILELLAADPRFSAIRRAILVAVEEGREEAIPILQAAIRRQ